MATQKQTTGPIEQAHKAYMQDGRKGPYDVDAFADAVRTMIENAVLAYDDHEKAERDIGPLDSGYQNPRADFLDWWYRTYVLQESEAS